MNDLISVIIPAYNSGKTIRDCLDSVLSQSYTEIEVLVIDDGSTDETSEIIKTIMKTDPRVKYFYKKNGGQSSARNVGLNNMRGKYFTFVDSDDYIKPEMLYHLYRMIENNKADVTICGYSNVCNGQETKLHCENMNIEGNGNAIKALLTEKVISGPVCKLYITQKLGNIRFREGIIFEDIEYLSRLFLLVDKMVTCDYDGYRYIIHPGSTTHSSFNKKYYDIITVTDLVTETVKKSNIDCKKELQCMQLTHYLTFLELVVTSKAETTEGVALRNIVSWIRKNYVSILLNNKIKSKRKIMASLFFINNSLMNKGILKFK